MERILTQHRNNTVDYIKLCYLGVKSYSHVIFNYFQSIITTSFVLASNKDIAIKFTLCLIVQYCNIFVYNETVCRIRMLQGFSVFLWNRIFTWDKYIVWKKLFVSTRNITFLTSQKTSSIFTCIIKKKYLENIMSFQKLKLILCLII